MSPSTSTPDATLTDAAVVGIVGLGEVGRTYGTALAGSGRRVMGYDPYLTAAVEGVEVQGSLAGAVGEADLVLVLTAAAASIAVATDAVAHLKHGAAYADLTSSSPAGKRSLESVFTDRPDVQLADVAILGPVISLGTRTPLMAAGPAAPLVARVMGGLGSPVDVVDGSLGDAMAHKLLRSVFMKGFAAAVTEAVAAGRAAGFEEWIREQIARELSGDGQATIDRWLKGSVLHARRRSDEMDAATGFLTEVGVDATMAAATAAHLRGLAQD